MKPSLEQTEPSLIRRDLQPKPAQPPKRDDEELLVSVVIPARNEVGYLEGALASVRGQTYPLDKLECIVVDNASVDETANVARTFASRYPELSVMVVQEMILGPAAAKNRGARVARGHVLVFLDADSRMEADLVRDVIDNYLSGSPAGSIRVVADSEDWLERRFFDLMEVGKVLFGLRAQMMYCEKEFFTRLKGFNPDLSLAEDLDFLQRAKRLVRYDGSGKVCHVRTSAILTSPRRLRQLPWRLSFAAVFVRWFLANFGIGRGWRY